jgi:hypothetical protein
VEERVIKIKKSETADTRTCDFANVTKAQLLSSSCQHIGDVGLAMQFFRRYMTNAELSHDWDKIKNIDQFHDDFVTGFKQTEWWNAHRKMHRHHLNYTDGIPSDVNLLDVLEYICDCVMAGMARSGEVYEIKIDPETLQHAFNQTVALLKSQVEVEK